MEEDEDMAMEETHAGMMTVSQIHALVISRSDLHSAFLLHCCVHHL